VDIRNHILFPVRLVDSPNQDARPDSELSLVVIHGISLPPGNFQTDDIVKLFTNCLDCSEPVYRDLVDMRVSSHVLIRRDGELIQFVPFNRRAWHAGESVHEGRSGCNDFSIGIELEGTDDQPYMDEQYDGLEKVIKAIFKEYGSLAVRGHSDISPGRKTDPGLCFDWSRISSAMRE
tara:strand:- start:154 stop:684 length:531 start_codon:yes stop_codon:yes gene_type:complete